MKNTEALRRGLDIDFVMVSDAYDGGQMLEDMKRIKEKLLELGGDN